jgi:hypothetical protein
MFSAEGDMTSGPALVDLVAKELPVSTANQ